jgi:hypothetical protein
MFCWLDHIDLIAADGHSTVAPNMDGFAPDPADEPPAEVVVAPGWGSLPVSWSEG